MTERDMTPQQLSDKYSGPHSWGAHPKFSRFDWRQEVASESTQLGYWDWVAAQIDHVAFEEEFDT